MKPERRVYALSGLQVRAADGTTPARITGHAAVFDQLSEDLGGFREKVAPGAFKRALKGADTRALFNHNPDYVLGRSTAGTLSLAEDLTGLAIEAEPPQTSWANDLLVSMERGDINQMSFAFTTRKDRWETGADGLALRTVLEVERLYDVSVVTYPAYPQTDAAVREALAEEDLDVDALRGLLARARHALPIGEADRALVARSIDILRGLLPSAPGAGAADGATTESTLAPGAGEWVARELRRLALVDKS